MPLNIQLNLIKDFLIQLPEAKTGDKVTSFIISL